MGKGQGAAGYRSEKKQQAGRVRGILRGLMSQDPRDGVPAVPRKRAPAEAGPLAEKLGMAYLGAFVRRDREAFLALVHPEAEMYLPRSALEGGPPYRGLAGAVQLWADAFDLWERFEGETRAVEAVGDVFVFTYRVTCFPYREGPPVQYEGHYVTEVPDGKIVYSRPYLDWAEAQRDAEARAASRDRPG